jgi:hypothetical protein
MGIEEELLRRPEMDLEFKPGRSSSCILLVIGRWLTKLESSSLSDCDSSDVVDIVLNLDNNKKEYDQKA